jgi:hypothetical protein
MGLYIKACYGFTFKPKNKDYTEYNEWHDNNPEKVEEYQEKYYEMNDDFNFMIDDDNGNLHYLTGLSFFNVYSGQFLDMGEAFQIDDDFRDYALEELKKAIADSKYDSFKDLENWECNVNLRVSS